MQAPYTFTQLYRKDAVPEEADHKNYTMREYYDAFEADIDLLQIVSMVQNYFNRDRITTLYLGTGVCIIALVSIDVLRKEIVLARNYKDRENLLMASQ